MSRSEAGDTVTDTHENSDPPAPRYVDRAIVLYQAEHEASAAALKHVQTFAEEHGIVLDVHAARDFLDDPPKGQGDDAHWVILGEDPLMLRALDRVEGHDIGLGLIPVGKLTRARRYFDLPSSLKALTERAFRVPELALDALRCNGELVLGQAAVGDVPFLDRRGQSLRHAQDTLWQRWMVAASLFWVAIRRMFRIAPLLVQLHIGTEEKPHKTAVTGIVLLENDIDHLAYRMVGETMSARDGRVTALLVAPTSVVRYLGFLLRAALGRSPAGALPRALSFVKTDHLVITSDTALDYRIDGVRHADKRIEIRVSPQALRVNVGARFDGMAGIDEDGKDTLRLANLPENESRLAMIRHRLPLFTHALEDDFKDLFLLLKDSARIGPDYVTLSILSALIGAFGLLLDSAAVIIGAMVLAPLMAPIICVAMAALRRDGKLFRPAMMAIGVGVGLALVMSALVAMIVPIRLMTPEIAARLSPSLLDLGVAVFSGVAGAYAYARESVMKSLPGVAIAVALVPPLAVAGIGIGWWDFYVFFWAMVLFATNLVGICLAGAITFMVLGFGPVQRTTRGLWMPALAVAIVAVPLVFAFMRVQFIWRTEHALSARTFQVEGETLRVENARVSVKDDAAYIRADLYYHRSLDPAMMQGLRAQLEAELQRDVVLDLSPRQRIGGDSAADRN